MTAMTQAVTRYTPRTAQSVTASGRPAPASRPKRRGSRAVKKRLNQAEGTEAPAMVSQKTASRRASIRTAPQTGPVTSRSIASWRRRKSGRVKVTARFAVSSGEKSGSSSGFF